MCKHEMEDNVTSNDAKVAYNEKEFMKQLEIIKKEMKQYVRSRHKKTPMWIIPGPITFKFE